MRSDVFGAFRTGNNDNNTILFLATKILQKYIWDCKLRKTIPGFLDVQLIILDEFNVLKKISKKFNEILIMSTINSLK